MVASSYTTITSTAVRHSLRDRMKPKLTKPPPPPPPQLPSTTEGRRSRICTSSERGRDRNDERNTASTAALPRRVPTRTRKRKIEIKYKRLELASSSPSRPPPSTEDGHSDKAVPSLSATATATPRRLTEDDSDQHSSPIGTFGGPHRAFSSSTTLLSRQRKQVQKVTSTAAVAANANQQHPSTSTATTKRHYGRAKRRRIQLQPVSTHIGQVESDPHTGSEDSNHPAQGMDVSEISFFTTCATVPAANVSTARVDRHREASLRHSKSSLRNTTNANLSRVFDLSTSLSFGNTHEHLDNADVHLPLSQPVPTGIPASRSSDPLGPSSKSHPSFSSKTETAAATERKALPQTTQMVQVEFLVDQVNPQHSIRAIGSLVENLVRSLKEPTRPFQRAPVSGWQTITNRYIEQRFSRLSSSSGGAWFQFQHGPPTTKSVCQDLGMKNGLVLSELDTVLDWDSDSTSGSEDSSVPEFSHGFPHYAGYSTTSAPTPTYHCPTELVFEYLSPTSSSYLDSHGKGEIVKLVIPISSPSLCDFSSAGVFFGSCETDTTILPSSSIGSTKPLLWMPTTLSRFKATLEKWCTNRIDGWLRCSTTTTSLIVYISLDRLVQVRNRLSTVTIDDQGRRPFADAAVKLLVLDAKGRGLFVI